MKKISKYILLVFFIGIADTSFSCDPTLLPILMKDQSANPALNDFFAGLPDGEYDDMVEAWEALVSEPGWRINKGYLSKVNRYADEGIDILEEGGKLKAKTANDLEIGELDIDELEEVSENALKVKGKFSGRHFDPDLAGGEIVRKPWQSTTINQAGIDDVITHTGRFDDALGENALMIDRLQKIKNGEISITDFDKRYYTHELEEYARYKNLGIADGVDPGNAVWNNAHSATLEVYSITDEASLIFQ